MAPIVSSGSGGDNAHNHNTTLPASILFSPKELKHYQRWQRETLHLSGPKLGRLPTATQYSEYQQWRTASNQDAQYLPGACRLSLELGAHLNPIPLPVQNPEIQQKEEMMEEDEVPTATKCKHALHPGYKRTKGESVEVDTCPCCIIEAHMRYMQVLTQVLDQYDEEPGRWAMRLGSDHERALEAWYCGKLHFVQTVLAFEKVAIKEAEWQGRHPEMCLDDVMSAEKAVKMYWTSMDLPAGDTRCAEKETKRRVSFGENTSFRPGRPAYYFRKDSPRYEPGRYSVTEGEDKESEFISKETDGQMVDAEIDTDEDSEVDFSSDEEQAEDSGEEECDGMDLEHYDDSFIVFG